MDCNLNWSYIIYGELWCDPVMIALKALNFKLELLLLRIMWVFRHFFTCRLTWSQLETFNLIGVNVIRQKSSKVNGDGKKHRSVPEVFSRGFATRGFGLRPKMCWPSANTENSRRAREKPLVPRVPIWWYFIQLYCTCKFLYKPLIRHQQGKNYFCPSWCKKIFPRLTKPRHFLFNPFCPWKSSIKMRLKLVERFSGHCLAKKN